VTPAVENGEATVLGHAHHHHILQHLVACVLGLTTQRFSCNKLLHCQLVSPPSTTSIITALQACSLRSDTYARHPGSCLLELAYQLIPAAVPQRCQPIYCWQQLRRRCTRSTECSWHSACASAGTQGTEGGVRPSRALATASLQSASVCDAACCDVGGFCCRCCCAGCHCHRPARPPLLWVAAAAAHALCLMLQGCHWLCWPVLAWCDACP